MLNNYNNNKFELKIICFVDTEKDNFINGCSGEQIHSATLDEFRKTYDTIEALEKDFKNVLTEYITESESTIFKIEDLEYYNILDNRLTTSISVNEDGAEPTVADIEAFENNEKDLYCKTWDYHFSINNIDITEIDFINLIERVKKDK